MGARQLWQYWESARFCSLQREHVIMRDGLGNGNGLGRIACFWWRCQHRFR